MNKMFEMMYKMFKIMYKMFVMMNKNDNDVFIFHWKFNNLLWKSTSEMSTATA